MVLAAAVFLLATAAADDAAPKETKSDVCHVPPGNPARSRTLSLPESAIPAHLGHGDAVGACRAEPAKESAKGEERDEHPKAEGGPKAKSPVCHVGDGESPKTLYLPAPGVRAHRRHGDAAGPCAGAAGEGAR